MPQPTLIRCDDCAIEFELFKDLVAASRCVHGRPHRAVRIHPTQRSSRAI